MIDTNDLLMTSMKMNAVVSFVKDRHYLEILCIAFFFIGYTILKSGILNKQNLEKALIYWKYNSFSNYDNFHKMSNLVLEGERISTRGIYLKNTEIMFSVSFKSVWNRIMQIKPDVISLKECVSIEKVYYQREQSQSDSEIDDNLNEIFIINQNLPFHIENDIYCEITVDEKKNHDKDNDNITITKYTIKLFSFTKSVYLLKEYVDELRKKYLNNIENEINNKTFLYDLRRINAEDYRIEWANSEFRSNKSFKNLFFHQKQNVIDKVNFFLENEEWYAEQGIPYTMGICLSGPPGTGKTSFIKALTNHCNTMGKKRHLVSMNLNLISTEDDLYKVYFDEKYSQDNHKPVKFMDKIIVIEDIDCMIDIIKKRSTTTKNNTTTNNTTISIDNSYENIIAIPDTISITGKNLDNKQNLSPLFKKKDAFSLSTLLNLIDGIQENHGRIIIITTNHYDQIDPALLREGRIDITLSMENTDYKILCEIFHHYYNESLESFVKGDNKMLKLKSINIMTSKVINILKTALNASGFIEQILNNY